MSENFTLTRAQIAAFVKDPRTVRALEKAVKNANVYIPSGVEEGDITTESSNSRGGEALTEVISTSTEINNAITMIEASLNSRIESVENSNAELSRELSSSLPSIKSLIESLILSGADIDSKSQFSSELASSAHRRAKFNGVMAWLSIQ